MKRTDVVIYGVALTFLMVVSSGCHKMSATSASPAPATPAAAVAPTQNPEDAMPRVSVEEAKAAVAKGEAVLVDVRGPDAYKMAHIKGAIDHSLSRMEMGDFEKLPKDKRIIAYCSCPTEHSSARAAMVLQKAGFQNAGALVGGNAAWENSGGEMVKAPPPTPESPAKAQDMKAKTKAKS